MSLTANDLVADARSRIKEIAPDRLAADAAGAVLIDVREPAEYAEGRLAGAVNLPRGVLEFKIDAHPALAARDRPLVVYCLTGGRAALAADALQRMGFHDVCSLAGGITAWRQAGLPVTTA